MIASDRRSPSLRPAPRVPKLRCRNAEIFSRRTSCVSLSASSAFSTSSLVAGVGSAGERLLIGGVPAPHPPAYQVHAGQGLLSDTAQKLFGLCLKPRWVRH